VRKKQIVDAAQTVLNALECSELIDSNCELSILLTNDLEIKKLNSKYRKKNKATDVLSFPLQQKTRFFSGAIGDVVISLDTASLQAKENGVSLQKEIISLLVHGILHLVGYDHENVSQRKANQMFKKERELLSTID
jgi:probable rRNA maturation factor